MAESQRSASWSSWKPTDPVPRSRIYRLEITLAYSEPPICRSFEVPGDITLDVLHSVIQIVMGWNDEHLHGFTIKDKSYGPDPDPFTGEQDEAVTVLNKVVKDRSVFEYEYDFGDSWVHILEVAQVVPPQQGAVYPRCIAGKRACPPEDCGGIDRFEEKAAKLRARKKPPAPERGEEPESSGRVQASFDPDAFDIEKVNAALARSFVMKDGRVKEVRRY